jgi:acylphosphatase
MEIRRARVIVRGQVQGVSFRVLARDRARTRGVLGWVRNRPDGSVEAVFEGDEGDVAQLVEWCRHGPPGAFVESVDVSWEDPEGERDFRIS